METPFYQVDAFTNRPFGGNPAGVMPLAAWLPDAQLQQIAAENNLPETAFFVPETDSGADYRLRWFTPTQEIELCGHATLAAAYIIGRYLRTDAKVLRFQSLSGILPVTRDGDRLTLDFPARALKPAPDKRALIAACLGQDVVEALDSSFYLAVLPNEAAVRAAAPDFAVLMEKLDKPVIVTARGQSPDVDFVSRFFAPHIGIPEDPVTGAAHCILVPYWAGVLGKNRFFAQQVSARHGDLWLSLNETPEGERVLISGDAVCLIEGKMRL